MSSRNLYEILVESATLHPEAPAIEMGRHSVTYRTLLDRVNELKAKLLARGVRPGDRVALMLGRDADEPAMLFALSGCRAVFASLNRLWKPAQISYALGYLRPKLFIAPSAAAGRLTAGQGFQPPPETTILAMETLVATVPPKDAGVDVGIPLPTDLAAIIFTSGSSGFPKGVMHTNSGLLRWTESTVRYLGNRPGDRVLALLPLAFGYGLNQLLCMIHCGGCYRISQSVLAPDIITELASHRITGLAGIPAFWRDFAGVLPSRTSDLGAFSLRYVTNAGGHCPTAVLGGLRERMGGVDIVLMYGTTETLRSAYLPPHLFDSKMGALGVPVPGAEVLLLNAAGEPCRPGEVGEIAHRGPTVARGYFGLEGQDDRFHPCPDWLDGAPGERIFHTGDLARLDDDGILWFESRRDRQIKINGFRVSPSEIEEVACELDFVEDALAVCLKDGERGETIHLALAVKSNLPLPREDEVIRFLRQRLANYMVPSAIHFWTQPFPRTANGKVDYAAIRHALGATDLKKSA